MRRIGCLLLGTAAAALDRGRMLRELALACSPRVEEAEDGLLYVDLTGVQGLLGDEAGIADGLRRRAAEQGLTVSVGIGGSRASARVAARGGDGARVVPPGEDAAALAPAPLSLLDCAPETATLFRRWGLRTFGELAALPPIALFERLGPEGLRLRELALGVDPRPLAPWMPPRLVEASVNLDWEVAELASLGEIVAGLVQEIAAGLAREDLDAGQLEWSLRLANGALHEGVQIPAVPTREPSALAALVRGAIEARRPPAAVTGIGLRAHPVRMARVQPSLTDPPRPNARTLAEVLSRLAALVGDERVGAPALLDTHRPDALALGSLRESTSAGPPGETEPPGRRRGLTGRGLALRRLRPPARAAVRIEDGRPAHLAAGAMAGAVVASVGPWRSSGEWWLPGAWGSDEWDAELEDGTLCRLAHDGSAWLLEGVYD